MDVKTEFPTAQEVEVIAQKKSYENPNLSKAEATELAEIELMRVIPESFNKMHQNGLNPQLDTF